jgi:N-acetylglutamate synthase-like GNAT family acetyltransferase
MSIRPAARRARPNDAARIGNLYAQLVGNPDVSVLPERIAEISTDTNTALFVIEVDGIVCGTALVSLCADVMFRAQPFAVVENVVVSAEARQKGIGKSLFREIEAFCLTCNCSKIMLLSAADRIDAHRFFASIGFAGSNKRGFVKYRSDFSGSK